MHNRPSMNPGDIIGKWARAGKQGSYATKDPKYGNWTHFSAEAMLYDTKAAAKAECVNGQVPEQVTGLRSRTASLARDRNETYYGGD